MASTWPAKNNYATGDVLTAANMNGVGDDLNDVYNFSGYAAGKNKILNSDFGIWQRGTSITPVNTYGYGADRWLTYSYGTSTTTMSQQTFAPGTAPVSGYEGTYYCRLNSTNNNTFLAQRIEDVRTFAGQTVTVSFWAKAASATSATGSITIEQNFGNSGSATVTVSGGSFSFTTSWARYSATLTIPSIAGKTIGASNFLQLDMFMGAINNNWDIWGVQLEAGSTASIFQTATGTKQGELAACQRYYTRQTALSAYARFSTAGGAASGTLCYTPVPLPVPLRAYPTAIDYSGLSLADGAGAFITITSATIDQSSPYIVNVTCNVASGLTQYRTYCIQLNNNSSAYLGFSAEL